MAGVEAICSAIKLDLSLPFNPFLFASLVAFHNAPNSKFVVPESESIDNKALFQKRLSFKSTFPIYGVLNNF